MTTRGRLESIITVPTGGWDAALVGTASATATIPAGTYYLSTLDSGSNDLLAEIASQFSSTTTDTVTCTGSLGESGTGKITIASDGGTFEITWTDTDLRDLLGFTANKTGATSYTGSNHTTAAWLPDSAGLNLNGSSSGWIESDFAATEAPDGTVKARMGQRKRVQALSWSACTRARTWAANESTTNESFQTFLTNCLYGELTWATVGGPIRWYPDADTDGTSYAYKTVGLSEYKPPQTREGWTGRWRIDLPRLVEVPS